MKYPVIKNSKYDFAGQTYSSSYPNLHKYPATMIPQIGIEILKELKINKGTMLDPYCGSGTSFIIGLDRGLRERYGYDINPLAILIARAKFTKVDFDKVKIVQQRLRNKVFEFVKSEDNLKSIKIPHFTNIDFWFSRQVLLNLSVLKFFIEKIKDKDIRRIFLVPFSETVRECSYTRSNEFKLYRIKAEDILKFNPDVFGVYFSKLNFVIDAYEKYYYPKLNGAKILIDDKKFPEQENFFDVVLTSPPNGDSSTTVAYGQFSHFSNMWMGIKYARQIDKMLMGGHGVSTVYEGSLISDYIYQIQKVSPKRALQVSSFYYDLASSIKDVSRSVRRKGKIIYVVGNRTVKDVQLPTDQFIAEQFERNGFSHVLTYERALSNKIMPVKNSPSNISGNHKTTIMKEYIVVCEKTH